MKMGVWGSRFCGNRGDSGRVTGYFGSRQTRVVIHAKSIAGKSPSRKSQECLFGLVDVRNPFATIQK